MALPPPVPPVELAPRPERPRADLDQVGIENPAPATAPAPVDLAPRPARPRADLDQVRIENPALAAAPAPVELAPGPERPRPDQERIAAAEAARREEERRREEARQRRDEEMQAAHVQDYAIDGTESDGAALAKRQPAPAGALWEAVRAQLEDQHAATPEVSGGAPRPVQKVGREIALEILAVAEHASRASSGRHAPPPRPEAIAEMAGAEPRRPPDPPCGWEAGSRSSPGL